MFFFEGCKATLLVALASLNEILFGLRSLDFEERDKR